MPGNRVLGAEEGRPLEPDLDLRRRQRRLERDDAAEQDVAHARRRALARDAQLDGLAVVAQRRPQLAGRDGDEDGAAHGAGRSRRAGA